MNVRSRRPQAAMRDLQSAYGRQKPPQSGAQQRITPMGRRTLTHQGRATSSILIRATPTGACGKASANDGTRSIATPARSLRRLATTWHSAPGTQPCSLGHFILVGWCASLTTFHRCPHSYHLWCLDPPLLKKPTVKWLCPSHPDESLGSCTPLVCTPSPFV